MFGFRNKIWQLQANLMLVLDILKRGGYRRPQICEQNQESVQIARRDFPN